MNIDFVQTHRAFLSPLWRLGLRGHQCCCLHASWSSAVQGLTQGFWICTRLIGRTNNLNQDTLNYTGWPDRGSKLSPDNCSKQAQRHTHVCLGGRWGGGHGGGVGLLAARWRRIAANVIAANAREFCPPLYCPDLNIMIVVLLGRKKR